MLLTGMKKLCRVCLAAALASALCVLTLVDIPPQLPEPPTDSPPIIPEREPPGTRSIVAYSWARRLTLDYRPSKQCRDYLNDYVIMDDAKFRKSSSPFARTKDFRKPIKAKSNRVGSIDDIDRSNKWLETIPRRLFLYTAHLDIRVSGYPSVRVIGVKREASSTLLSSMNTLYCTIWYIDKDGATRSFSMEAHVSDIWLDEWGGSSNDYTGVLVTCQLPRTENLRRVYVGTKSCYENSSHSLLVKSPPVIENSVKNRDEFTVCIKSLDFDEDISDRLVAFFELNRILGARMIYVYVFKVHENVSRVLRAYEKSNVVRWFDFQLPGDLPNDVEGRRRLLASDLWTKRRMELIPYNHCFYDNLYTSEFVVPIDIDETIIPTIRDDWKQLLNDLKRKLGRSFKDFASYAVRNVYFFPEVQNDTSTRFYKKLRDVKKIVNHDTGKSTFHYLDTVRTLFVSPIGDSVKSFVSTDRTLTVHNHYALTTLDPATRRAYHLDPRDAIKHHHRTCDQKHLDCPRLIEKLQIDENVLKYANRLGKRVKLFYETL